MARGRAGAREGGADVSAVWIKGQQEDFYRLELTVTAYGTQAAMVALQADVADRLAGMAKEEGVQQNPCVIGSRLESQG